MTASRLEITAGPVREPFAVDEIECEASEPSPHWSELAGPRVRVRRDPLVRELLAPLDEHAFVTSVLGRRTHHGRCIGRDLHRRVLTLEGLLRSIAEQRLPPGSLAFMRGDQGEGREHYDPESFTRTQRGFPLYDLARVRDYLARGRGSMIAYGLDHFVPAVRRLTAGLAEVTGARTGANAYYTPARSRAFSAHWDTHDVLVLQLHGTKRWHVWEPLLEHPLPRRPHMESKAYDGYLEDLERSELELGLGDVLYLPAGTPHAAWTEGEDSLHLTISIDPLRWHDLLRETVEHALLECEKELELRAPCPAWFLGLDDERVHAQQRHALDRLCAHLRSARLGDSMARLLAPERGELGPVSLELPPVGLSTELERSRGPAFIDEHDDATYLIVGSRRLRFPEAAAAALRFVLEHDALRPSALPGLDDDGRLSVARRLVDEGLLHHRIPGAALHVLPHEPKP